MNNEKTIQVNCPTCNKSVAWTEESKYRPFCSNRCQLIDLGAWSTEEYKIPENQTQEEWSETEDAVAPSRHH